MFGGPRQKGSWRPLHPRSRVHFPGLNITPSDIIRFPPRVAGLFRTQRAHVSYPDPSTSQLRMDYITATLEGDCKKSMTDGMLIVCTRDRQLDRNSFNVLMVMAS